jgi:hypothetical protein
MPLSRRMPHILCFAPYTDWSIHSARQVTILRALRARGATVTYVTCDGVFSDCDLLQSANGAPNQKPDNACLACQARVATRLAEWNMPFRWLGRWLSTEDHTQAAKWVQSLRASDYPTACHGDWQIGAWVKSSVHSHLRHNVLDFAEPTTASVFASYLYSGYLACCGLSKLLAEEQPDIQLLFNGRMAPTRIALELAKARGIRTICEERGYAPGRIALFDNVNCLDFSTLDGLWESWKSTPLSATEIGEMRGFLDDRWRGRSQDISVFSRSIESPAQIFEALRFDPNRPLWALFTSSLDEVADQWRPDGAFKSQHEWIQSTIAHVADRPDIQLAIRVHPNVGGPKSLGKNPQDLAFFNDLRRTLPPNVRLISSDNSLSSYGLAAAASAGMVWLSTIGIEMAALGRPVVRAGGGWLAQADFFKGPRTVQEYMASLNTLVADPVPTDLTTAVLAWRFAYAFFFRASLSFPLVRQPRWYAGEMAYEALSALEPGRDVNLDRICSVFLERRPVHDKPATRAEGRDAVEQNEIAAAIVSLLRDGTAH